MSLITENPIVDPKPNSFSGLFYLADGAAIFGCIGNPSGVIVANKRSLAISDNGNVYIKNSDGDSANWSAISGGGGGGVNPTSLFVPYNNAGTFADSPLKRTAVDSVRVNDGTTDYVSLGSGGIQTFFDGSASFPAININSRGGLYGQASPLAVILGLGGSANKIWTATQEFSVPNGSASLPAYSFNGDGDTGVYDASANVLGLAAGGVSVIQADGSTASAAVGLKVTANISGGGVTLAPINGGATEPLIISAKGASQVALTPSASATLPTLYLTSIDSGFAFGLGSNNTPAGWNTATGGIAIKPATGIKAISCYVTQTGVFGVGDNSLGNSVSASVDIAWARQAANIWRATNGSTGAGGLIIGSSTANGVAGTLTLEPLATPGSPVSGGLWSDNSFNSLSTRQAGLTENLSGTIFSGTADKTVQNTVTETTLLPSGTGTASIPANFWKAGKIIRLTLRGEWFTDAVAPTLNLRVRRNTTTMTASGAITCPAGLLGQFWEIVVDLVCRTTGASGSIQVCGSFRNQQDFTTRGEFVWDMGGSAPNTVDTTVLQAIDISAQWGTANPNNIFTCQQYTVEVLN